eukprot:4450437-Amphidinium_carterae.2
MPHRWNCLPCMLLQATPKLASAEKKHKARFIRSSFTAIHGSHQVDGHYSELIHAQMLND